MNAVVEMKPVVKSSMKRIFRLLIEGVESIPFNHEWANGTGYLDHAVIGEHAPKLEQGQVVQSVDEHGRRICMVGTIAGNCVVFERFAKDDLSVIVSNVPTSIRKLLDLSDGSLDKQDLHLIFGDAAYLHNIGIRVKKICDIAVKLKEFNKTA